MSHVSVQQHSERVYEDLLYREVRPVELPHEERMRTQFFSI
jgi:hypothetical protein